MSGEPGDLLIIVDHASNVVPAEIDLGIPSALLEEHIAWDIGAAALGQALSERLGAGLILAEVSRLVIDLNREEGAGGLIVTVSDGHAIPGNAALDAAAREARVERYWRPYHRRLEETIEATRPKLLISLHSFTPRLTTRPNEDRPWQVGVLYNEDDRAARVAIPLLEAAGVCVGDQLPYSGKLLNATMNRHGEATGIAYLSLEVRQDLISDADGVAHWARLLAPVIHACRNSLAQEMLTAT